MVTHITGRDAGRSRSAGVAAISSYLMVSVNVKPSKTGATAIWSRRWGVGGGRGGGRGLWCGGEGRGWMEGGWREGSIYIIKYIYNK